MASHTVMSKKLAQALMEAGMQHFDSGGTSIGGVQSADPTVFAAGQFGFEPGGVSDPSKGMGNMAKGLASNFTAQNMFQATAPNIETQSYSPLLAEQYGNQQNIYNQQQSLAQALLQQSQGQGPNIAQNQLNQATAQNVAQQGALMAGQRGASSNPALIARQAAMQGAAAQQQAAGQSATLQAQQQMAAQQALAQQQAAMANQSLQAQSILQGARAQQNNAVTQGSIGAQNINAQIAGQNAGAINQTMGGFLGAGGSLLSSILNQGGTVKKMADGGDVVDDEPGKRIAFDEMKEDPNPVLSALGDAMTAAAPMAPVSYGSMASVPAMQLAPMSGINPNIGGGGGGGGGGLGGLMALLNQGGDTNQLMKKGGKVPGKANVPGNSPKNDVVPALLSPGEEVIDRETLQDDGPVGKAARYVAKAINAKKKEKEGEGDDAEAPSKAKEFMKHLKKKKGYDRIIETRKAMGGKG